MALEITAVVLARIGGGYGEGIAGGLSGWLVNPSFVLLPVGFAVPMLAALLAFRSLRALAVVALALLSQLVVYSGIGMSGHYLYPAALATTGATVVSLYALRKRAFTFRLCLIACLLAFVVSWRNPAEIAREWAAEGARFHAEMRAIATENSPTVTIDSLLIEYRVSAATWLRYYGYTGEIHYAEQ